MGIANPCKSVCQFEKNVCIECFRLTWEKYDWHKYTEDEKKFVLKLIALRKKRIVMPTKKVQDVSDYSNRPLP